MAQRFTQTRSVVLNAAGAGQVDLYPSGGDWVVVHTSVATTTAVLEPTTRLYRDTVSAANFIEGSYTGSNDASDTRHVLQQGDSLHCVWSGGDVGARATMVCTIVQYPAGTAPME